jgi:uncharacterized membrane protein YagU involved in acid resistance
MSVGKAILWGGSIAGLLDATDGVVAFGLMGMNPVQVLQYIASGMLGAAAFQGGLATAGLGLLLHFFIAFTVAVIYVAASRRVAVLREKPAIFGLLFGAAVYLTMTYAVLPHSMVAPSAFSMLLFLNGIVGHALFVGLPISLNARKVAA